jgi:hypothetical protein
MNEEIAHELSGADKPLSIRGVERYINRGSLRFIFTRSTG